MVRLNRQSILNAIKGALMYVFGVMLYRIIAHHQWPQRSNLLGYLEMGLGFVAATIVIVWFQSRRAEKYEPDRFD